LSKLLTLLTRHMTPGTLKPMPSWGPSRRTGSFPTISPGFKGRINAVTEKNADDILRGTQKKNRISIEGTIAPQSAFNQRWFIHS
jgi:hypothetical protein